MGFVLTGLVQDIRSSTNQTTGEVAQYVQVLDMGLDQTVTVKDAAYLAGVQRGAQIQIPVSVRLSTYNNQSRLSVIATGAAQIARPAAPRT